MTFKKKTLIIGGTGSLGQHLVEHLLDSGLFQRKITVMSRDEQKHFSMSQRWPDINYVVHDIRDRDGIYDVVKDQQVVINCAAMKHIYRCEDDVLEAVKTNVLGLYNVLKAVRRSPRTISFVHISTDKAPEPTTMYGATKMLGEGLVRNFASADNSHYYSCCRYGNVLLSKGSVIPKFIDLSKRGLDLVVTHPHVTRFLMHMDDAVDLIMMAASEEAPSGSVLIPLDLPSCEIYDLAQIVLEKYTITGNKNKVVVGKLGRGEKLHEVLLNAEEAYAHNVHEIGKTKSGYPIAYVTPGHTQSEPMEYSSKTDIMTKDELKVFLEEQGVL